MAEWIVERGIAEDRAMLVDGEEVLAAKVCWPGSPNPGSLHDARLASRAGGASRGVARLADGTEVLLDKLPRDVTEGSAIRLIITRAPIAERGRLKRAVGKLEDAALGGGGGQRDDCFGQSLSGEAPVRHLPHGRFLDHRWDDIWDSASEGCIDFPGGSLLLTVTPAMTVIDVDGTGSPRDLSLAAAPAVAKALRWFDIGGIIGIDFPTIVAKAERKAVDAALDEALAGWPHERTAMNGFGFVQIVARLEGPSLLHRFATSRLGMAARMALRRAEMASGPGEILLTIHPALERRLKQEWLDELQRRTGRPTRIETDPGLAIEAAQAQIVAR